MMAIRNKFTLNAACLVVFLGLLAAISSSGCMESKASAAEEINTSILLINSAESKIGTVSADLDSGTFTNAKIALNSSKIDFEESLKILNNASSDYDEETQEIERCKLLAKSGLDRVSFLESLIFALEHLEKSVAYMEPQNLDLSRKELDKMNEDLNTSMAYLSSAKEKIFTINPDSVPVTQKSSIYLLRSDLETSEKMISEMREFMNGLYPYLDGTECILNGTNYAEAKKWNKAAGEFANASVKFSESKNTLEKLKDSEYSEVSVSAIKICGFLNQIEKDLPHFEAGCRYMDQGRYSQAKEEFSKISDYPKYDE